MRTMDLGTTKSLRFGTSEGDSAAALGNIGVAVVSSVALIAMVEECCGQLLSGYLEPGEASVGSKINVTHHGPVPLMGEVWAQARVIEIKRHTVTFATACHYADALVMDGLHERVVVDLQRFLAGVGS